MTFRLGVRYTTIFAIGESTVFGKKSMMRCERTFGCRPVASRNRVLQSSTVNPSKRRKRGVHGYDAGKKVNGRKRHLIVDTMGLILAIVVHPANIQDRDGAKLVFEKIRNVSKRLQLIWADGGYTGQLIDWVKATFQWTLEIIKRSDDQKGFKVLPRRWVVERTFGWLGRYRRLSKDYEYLTETSETMAYIAMIHVMVRRLTTPPLKEKRR